MARFVSIFFLFFFLNSTRMCLAASRCYYPNGIEANDSPCDPDADESVCCGGGLGAVCLSNKLCIGADGNTMRGSCTDKNWTSPECAMFCLSADKGGTNLISCSNVTNSDTSYCCDHNPNCCNNGLCRFHVLPSNHETWATWDRKATKYTVVGTMFSDESTSTVAPATATAGSSGTVTSEAFASTTSKPDMSESSNMTPGLSTGTKVGIGIGVGLGAMVTGAVVYLLWKMGKNKKAANRDTQTPPANYEPTPTDLHGHQFQGYSMRAELPAHK